MRLLFAAAIAAFVSSTSAQEPPVTSAVFTPIGMLPGSQFCQPYAISRDGTTVVGQSPVNFANLRAFSWRASTGMQQLGAPGEFTEPNATSVNADGSIIGGNACIPGTINYRNAVRWTNGTPTNLEAPTIESSDAWAMNADGSVMTGFRGNYAYRWTQGGGYQNIGALPTHTSSRGFGISDDGNVIVGISQMTGFRWTAGGMVELPHLSSSSFSSATAVSGNGSVTVGASGNRAVRWVGTGPAEMLFWSGGVDAEAYGVDFDGNSIVGRTSLASGPSVAFLWTPDLGFKDLNTWLPTLGVNLTGWQLYEARGISSDGLTIVGTGYHTLPGGGMVQEGFVVQIPAPAGSVVLSLAITLGARRGHRRSTFTTRRSG